MSNSRKLISISYWQVCWQSQTLQDLGSHSFIICFFRTESMRPKLFLIWCLKLTRTNTEFNSIILSVSLTCTKDILLSPKQERSHKTMSIILSNHGKSYLQKLPKPSKVTIQMKLSKKSNKLNLTQQSWTKELDWNWASQPIHQWKCSFMDWT